MLTREDMARLLACGASTFDRYRSLGSIGPQPVNLGGSGSLRWNRREVMAWLEHRDNRGELHDSKTWAPVWAQLQRKAGIGR
jgi:predicted DNA-binding transcriptional regulator AlpA